MKGIFITATDTGVGKTVVTGLLARTSPIRPVDVWKPVQSGENLQSSEADHQRLHQLAGMPGEASRRVGVSFELPYAPWIAARRIGQVVPYEALIQEAKSRIAHQFCLIEGAGGVHVPLTADKSILDFAQALALPCLVVARPGLGTVNHTVLTVNALRDSGLHVLGVIVNGHTANMEQQAIEENIEMIERFAQVRVLGVVPWLEPSQLETGHPVFEQIWGRILND
jgi:dethiobiotin synthetase